MTLGIQHLYVKPSFEAVIQDKDNIFGPQRSGSEHEESRLVERALHLRALL